MTPPVRAACRALARGLGLVALAFSSGCGSETAPEGEVALWTLDRSRPAPDSTSTSFSVLVTRLGCHSGVTGDVLPPDIELEDERVIVTFSVDPDVGPTEMFDCQGNNEVPYAVDLEEPVGMRALVDGNCLEGREGATTRLCPLPGGLGSSPLVVGCLARADDPTEAGYGAWSLALGDQE